MTDSFDPRDLLRGALGHEPPAVRPRPGAEVHHVVGGADDALLVLDDDHGVAAVAQAEEGLREGLVVARVQAHRRLVEDVADAAQVRGERRHDADALGLAGGEGVGPALEGEVAEAEAVEEVEPQRELRPDALAHLLGQLALERPEPLPGLDDGEGGDVADVPAGDPDRPRLGPQAGPGAGAAGRAVPPPRLAVLLDPGRPEPVALGTGAVLLAPREQARVGGGEAGPAARAGAARRVEALGPAGSQGQHRPRAQLERAGDGLLEAGAAAASRRHASHERLHVVDLEAVDARRLRRVVEGAVDPDLGDALLRHRGDRVEVEALAPPDEGREDGQVAGREVLADARGEGGRVDHLAGQAALRAVDRAEAGPEEAQVVVDLARGADGRQRRAARELLLEGDRGRHALEAVDLGPGEGPDELAHVGREAVEEPPLALGEEHVEGEGGLAGAGDAGDRHQLVARDVHRDPLQVVLPRADDADAVGGARAGGRGEVRAPLAPRRGRSSRSLRRPRPWTGAGARCRRAQRRPRPASAPAGRRVELRHRLRRPFADDPAALVAGLGAEVQDPVGGERHLGVVLDHDDGVAGVHEAVHRADQDRHVRGVQAGRGLVEQVQPPGRRPRLGEGLRELQPLRFSAGERRRRLRERQVAEAEVEHGLEGLAHARGVAEEAGDVGRGQVEGVRDREAPAAHLEHLGAEAAAVAGAALHEGVGEELHLDLLVPGALAHGAGARRGVEREGGGLEAALAGLGRLREELAQRLEDAHVGRGVDAGGRPEGGLVHEGDPGELSRPVDPVAGPGLGLAEAELPAQVAVEHLVDERGLARSRRRRSRTRAGRGGSRP